MHRVIDDWLDNIDNNLITGVVSLDIEKCYNTLDHNILIHKLDHYGVSGKSIEWFKQYLSKRTQIVYFNNSKSDICELNIGLPQGSVLGPLLFLVYINDLSSNISLGQCNLFADDALLYSSGETVHEVQNNLQATTNSATSWYKNNKLSINASKSTSMLIHSHHKSINSTLSINVNNDKLSLGTSAPYIGVTIDQTLQWNAHINSVIKKISPKIYQLRRLSKYVPSEMLNTIYLSCIQSHIDYCCTVWGTSSRENITKIQRMQNMAARIICKEFDFINVRGIDLVKKLGWMNIDERVRYLTACLMYKCINNHAPNYLSDNINLMSDLLPYNNRSTNTKNVMLPKPRTELYKTSFNYNGPKVWNGIPNDIEIVPLSTVLNITIKSILMYSRHTLSQLCNILGSLV